jgi:hypothetical protein
MSNFCPSHQNTGNLSLCDGDAGHSCHGKQRSFPGKTELWQTLAAHLPEIIVYL